MTARRRWLPWLVFLGALAAAGGGFAIWIDRAADRRWERMVRRVAELKAEAEGRDGARPVYGEPLEGNAWEDYEKAAAAAPVFPDRSYIDSVLGNPAAAALALQGRHPSVQHLRRGVRRSLVRLPEFFRRTGAPSCLDMGEWVLKLAIRDHETGPIGESTERLLDVCQLARDLSSDTNLKTEEWAHLIYGRALTALEEDVRGFATPSEVLKSVARRAEVLDRSFPSRCAVLMNTVASRGEQYSQWALWIPYDIPGARGDWEVLSSASDIRSWRHVWNARIGVTDAFDRLERRTARRVEAEGKPWPEARAALRTIAAEAVGCPNPLVREVSDQAFESAVRHREIRARLRLVRIAAHYRATGEVLQLDDPFGEKMNTELNGGRLRAWSVGPDGKGSDLALEVRR